MSLWPPMWFDLLHEGNFEAMGIEGNMGVEKGKNWEEEEMEGEKVEGERAAISSQLVSRSLALSACNLLFNPDVKSSSRQDLVVVCHCKRQLATRGHLDDEVRVPLWGHTL